MAFQNERRQNWSRIIGLERRGAPLDNLLGHPLPDPTKLIDEDFIEVQPSPRKGFGSRAHPRPLRFSGRWIQKGHLRTQTEIRLLLRRKIPQNR